jgi:hypothetical protein
MQRCTWNRFQNRQRYSHWAPAFYFLFGAAGANFRILVRTLRLDAKASSKEKIMNHRFLSSTFLTICLGSLALAQGSWSDKINWADPNEMDEGIKKHYRAIHVALLPSGDVNY